VATQIVQRGAARFRESHARQTAAARLTHDGRVLTEKRALVRARLGDQLAQALRRSQEAFLVVWAELAGHSRPIHRIGVRSAAELDELFGILWDLHPESGSEGIRWTIEAQRARVSRWVARR
jgi:hypothetical protein